LLANSFVFGWSFKPVGGTGLPCSQFHEKRTDLFLTKNKSVRFNLFGLIVFVFVFVLVF